MVEERCTSLQGSRIDKAGLFTPLSGLQSLEPLLLLLR